MTACESKLDEIDLWPAPVGPGRVILFYGEGFGGCGYYLRLEFANQSILWMICGPCPPGGPGVEADARERARLWLAAEYPDVAEATDLDAIPFLWRELQGYAENPTRTMHTGPAARHLDADRGRIAAMARAYPGLSVAEVDHGAGFRSLTVSAPAAVPGLAGAQAPGVCWGLTASGRVLVVTYNYEPPRPMRWGFDPGDPALIADAARILEHLATYQPPDRRHRQRVVP